VVYEEDAELIADEFYHSRTVIKTWDLAKKTGAAKAAKVLGPSYINLSQTLTETVVKSLINEKRLKVEIYSLSDERKWFLYKKGSPGNVQQLEDLLYARAEVNESPIMASISWTTTGGQRVVGVACCDALLKRIYVSEFLDSENFSNLESLLVQVSAKECYTPPLDPKDKDCAKIAEILERCDVVHSISKKSNFDASKSIEQDLATLLGKHFVDAHAELELKTAMGATAALLAGLELLASDENLGSFRLSRYDLSQFVRLDASAVQALNLVPNSREGNQQYNLYGLLNRCKTSMGSRKLAQWIKQPLVSLEAINRRHDIVEIFTSDTTMLSEIRGSGLRGISDIERITKKIQRGKANLQDCVLMYAFTQKLPYISGYLSKYCGGVHKALLEEKFINKIAELSQTFQRYMSLIEEVVDLASIDEGEYQISPNFDEALQDLQTQKQTIKAAMKKREYEVKIHLKSPDHFALEYDKVYGWVYRVTKKEEKVLETKENKLKFTVLANVKSGIKFQDSTLRAHSEEYSQLNQRYAENCRDILSKVMDVVKGYVPNFEAAQELVAELDVFASFAEASQTALRPYIRPHMHAPGDGNTVLLKSRHPVLETSPDVNFVPNDCQLVRGDSSFIIITGPNMGGKSTFIRQVGTIVLMAQIGCFVPCDEGSEICIVDAILARVGAGDSQLRGVSTFMSEMLETATILKTATKDSLVIIDELGRGTSTYDGFGLAWAISEYLAGKVGCFCLFATHFHELTQLSDELKGVTNQHVEARLMPDAGLVLMYTIAPGPADQSFGIEVAKLARFPESVIAIAKEKAQELESFDQSTKSVISGSSSSASQLDEAQADAFISSILSQFADLPVDSMTPEQIKDALDEIKKQVDASQIPLVQQLLAAEMS
jgi:DNA mismatch repair protein MSH2